MTQTHDGNFSIIAPTFREAKNIPEMIERISRLQVAARKFEVILVDDDSGDGIVEIVKELKARYSWLRLIVRKAKKSLSVSALEGFRAAHYPLIVLMDADLSHPPEKIPELLARLEQPGVDFVIGSRYIEGGSADEKWPVARRFTSRCAAWLAQILIFRRVKDPLSGFFALRASTLRHCDRLKPIGWKIGLELMLKCRCKNIQEVPIHFSERLHGKSKFNPKVAGEYLWHVTHLLVYKLSFRQG